MAGLVQRDRLFQSTLHIRQCFRAFAPAPRIRSRCRSGTRVRVDTVGTFPIDVAQTAGTGPCGSWDIPLTLRFPISDLCFGVPRRSTIFRFQPEVMIPNRSELPMRASLVACLALCTLAACGSGLKNASQVAVKIHSDEISIHPLNERLGR